MKIENGFETRLIIKNTHEEVKMVNIRYRNNTPTFSTDTFERREFSNDYRKEYVEDYITDVFSSEIYAENPTLSFNDFVEQIADDTYEFIDILGDVEAFKELNNGTVIVYQLVSCGQDFDEENPFKEVHSKHHLKKRDDFPKEIIEVIKHVETTVEQVPSWVELNYEDY